MMESPKRVTIESTDNTTIISEEEWITKIKKMEVPVKSFKTIVPPKTIHSPFYHHSTRTQRKDYELDNARLFVLDPVLKDDECKHFIQQLEQVLGFDDMSKQYPAEYRSNDRVTALVHLTIQTIVIDTDLAGHLWDRIEPILEVKDVFRIRPVCFGNSGLFSSLTQFIRNMETNSTQ